MTRLLSLMPMVALLATVVCLGGCGSPSSSDTSGLAKLSPEDRAAAEQQQTCPVSGKPLGSMGTPSKVQVDGRDIFVCCPGCKRAVQKTPERYLTKLTK